MEGFQQKRALADRGQVQQAVINPYRRWAAEATAEFNGVCGYAFLRTSALRELSSEKPAYDSGGEDDDRGGEPVPG